MSFWIIITLLAVVVSGLMVLALFRGRSGDEAPAAYDLRVYRSQLKEVDRDLARGVISPDDADRTRAEISRRILAADTQLREGGDTGGQPKGLGIAVALLSTLLVVGGSLWVYQDLGAPDYPDQALEDRIARAEEARRTRPSQDQAEASVAVSPEMGEVGADYMALMEKLRATVAERPDDLQGQRLLARNEATLGNFKAARLAQARVVELLGDNAQASDHTELADMMILSAGGYVSPEAEAALSAALRMDPKNGVARYYMGLMFAQVGRPDATFKTWDDLLRESAGNAPWVPPIRGQIEEIAFLAGVKYELPALAEAKGPSAEDMQAASEMSEEDREAMIRSMVSSLAERLASEGGAPEEWARLISAYGVLGETGRAQAIWKEAQQVFAEAPEALAVVESGARSAGLLQ